jgi:hypothetical protein
VSEPLARISLEVDGPRGPDVDCEITVPAEWFTEGCRIEFDVPARLTCASCAGGGCDACGRSGAFDVPKADTPLELTLPLVDSSQGRLRVRIPGLGAPSRDPEQPRGHLMLSVRVGEGPSRGVQVLPSQAEPSGRSPGAPLKPTTADPAFVLRILLMVAFVSLLFVFLLRFSGWM